MRELIIKNWQNQEVEKLTLETDLLTTPLRRDILHMVVSWQRNSWRLGCHKTLQRSEINKTKKKSVKQKGTGGARHGARSANIFVGGGVTFGPLVRSHATGLNKKVRKLGLKVAISDKFTNGTLWIMDSLKIDSYKTKEFVQKLQKLGIESALIVTANPESNLLKAAANVPNVDVIPVIGLNVYDILNHKNLIMDRDTLNLLEERLNVK